MTLARRRTDFRPYSDGPYRRVLGFLARYTSLIVMTMVVTLFLGSVFGQQSAISWFLDNFWLSIYQGGLAVVCIAVLMVFLESVFGQ